MSFSDELEIFRKEANAAAQFLYGGLALNALAAENPRVLDRLNDAPLFWGTVMHSLQKSAILALGRIFQLDTPHNVARLLRLAEDVSVFSKEALALRKQGNSPTRPEWLDDYLTRVYEPTAADIRVLKKEVARWRNTYHANYRPLRNMGYAHRELPSDAEAWHELLASTRVDELERMCTFLIAVHDALQELYLNGRKPDVQEREHSVLRMLARTQMERQCPRDNCSRNARVLPSRDRLKVGRAVVISARHRVLAALLSVRTLRPPLTSARATRA